MHNVVTQEHILWRFLHVHGEGNDMSAPVLKIKGYPHGLTVKTSIILNINKSYTWLCLRFLFFTQTVF